MTITYSNIALIVLGVILLVFAAVAITALRCSPIVETLKFEKQRTKLQINTLDSKHLEKKQH